MDILIPLVDIKEQEVKDLIRQVESSNLNQPAQDDLVNILYTVIDQVAQAHKNGWL